MDSVMRILCVNRWGVIRRLRRPLALLGPPTFAFGGLPAVQAHLHLCMSSARLWRSGMLPVVISQTSPV